MAVLSALKITCLMNKINARCFVVRIGNIRYVVKYGKIDEFVCLMLPKVVVIESMITAPVTWQHEYQWYKPI